MSTAPSDGSMATIQAIIIAFVGGGLIVVGVTSIWYRRKKRRDFIAAVESNRQMRHDRWEAYQATTDWVRYPDGRLVPFPIRDGVGFGELNDGTLVKEPELWDANVDMADDDMVDLTYSGTTQVVPERWNPVALSFPDFDSSNGESSNNNPISLTPNSLATSAPHTTPTFRTSNPRITDPENTVEMSVLIAFPDPHRPGPSKSRTTATNIPISSNNPYSPNRASMGSGKSRFEEDGDLPPLVIASTELSVRVSDGEEKDWRKFRDDIRAREEEGKLEALRSFGSHGGIRIDRTDGFRNR